MFRAIPKKYPGSRVSLLVGAHCGGPAVFEVDQHPGRGEGIPLSATGEAVMPLSRREVMCFFQKLEKGHPPLQGSTHLLGII